MTADLSLIRNPRANPMAGNPLATKDDVRRAVVDLVEPIVPHLSPGGARARLGSFGAAFAQRVAELEGYARPLWGIVPLVAGGGKFEHWDRWVAGLANGADPDSAEYVPTRTGHVEICAGLGNVTIRDGAPFIHLHLVLSERDAAAVGGHAMEGCRAFVVEAYFRKLDGPAPVRQEVPGMPLKVLPGSSG